MHLIYAQNFERLALQETQAHPTSRLRGGAKGWNHRASESDQEITQPIGTCVHNKEINGK